MAKRSKRENEETISLIRDRIKGELHGLRYDVRYFCTFGSLMAELSWIKSELKAITSEWAGIRGMCKNSYHKNIARKEEDGFCPDCGIAEFEFIFKQEN